MMKQASRAGLIFKSNSISDIEQSIQTTGRLYDSRAGIAGYYRYEPRHLDPPCDKQGAQIKEPKVHESVLVRMATQTDGYAPISMPSRAHIAVEDSWADIQAGGSCGKDVYTLEEYTALRELRGPYPKLGDLEDGRKILKALVSADADARALVWDTVWWRRVAYFATILMSCAIFIYPKYPMTEYFNVVGRVANAFDVSDNFRLLRALTDPMISAITDSLGSFLPGIFSPWLKALREDTGNFMTASLLLIGCIFWSSLLDRRIRDRSFAIYNSAWRDSRLARFKESLRRRKLSALWSGAFAGLIALFILFLYSRQTDCGKDRYYVCTGIMLAYTHSRKIVGGAALLVLAYSALSLFVIHQLEKQSASTERRGLALWFSHTVRTCAPLTRAYAWLTSNVVPTLFAALVLYAAVSTVNRMAFNSFSIAGRVCQSGFPPYYLDLEPGEERVVILEFSSLCQRTKIGMKPSGRYTISLMQDESFEEWFEKLPDDKKPEYAPLKQHEFVGFPSDAGWAHLLGFPFRRTLTAELFVVFGRVGDRGNDEYPVDEKVTFSPKEQGQLFLFANNEVVGLPGLYGLFYTYPNGVKVLVRRAKTTDDTN